MLKRSSVRAPDVCAIGLQGFCGGATLNRRISKRVLTITRCVESAVAPRLLQGTLRVFAVSDLHTHHPENLNWVRQLSTTAYQQDVLIVAGDISDDLEDLRVTLSALKERFAVVFFCPGNHELWVAGKQRRLEGGTQQAAAAATVTDSPAAQWEAVDRPASSPQPEAPAHLPSRPRTPSPQLLRNRAANLITEAASPRALGLQTSASQAPEDTRVSGTTAQRPTSDAAAPAAPPRDSLEKLARVMAACEELGVVVKPARLGRLLVVPLLAWHHKAFDCEPDIPGIPRASALTISDYARCVWPHRILEDLQRLQHHTRSSPNPPLDQRSWSPPPPGLQQQQQQQGSPAALGDLRSSASDAASSTSAPVIEDGADWGEGGHGSSAVAAWFDALNDSCPSWRGSYSGTSRPEAIHHGEDCSSNSSNSSNSSSSSGTGTDALRGVPVCAPAGYQVVQPRADSPPSPDQRGASWGGDDALCQSDQSPSGSKNRSEGAHGEAKSEPRQPRDTYATTGAGRAGREEPRGGLVVAAAVAGVSGPAEEASEASPAADRIASEAADDVISFSHFLPRQELLPEKRYLTFPNLAKAVGSTYLGRRVQRLRPRLHVFGHTHFAWDATHDGIRYVQAPLAYPSERRFRLRSLVMTAVGGPLAEGRRGAASAASRGAAQVSRSAGPLAQPAPPASEGGAQAAATAAVLRDGEEGPVQVLGEVENDEDDEEDLDPRGPSPAPAPMVEAAGAPYQSRAPNVHLGEPQQQQQAERRQESGLAAPWPSSSDPRDAGWLPLCVYRAEYTVRLHRRRPRADAEGERRDAPAAEAAEALILLHSAVDAAAGAATGDWTAGSAAGTTVRDEGEVEVVEWRSQWCPEQAAMWSSHYQRHPRRPHELQLAPWVAERYIRRMRRNLAKRALGATAPSAASAPPPAAVAAGAAFLGRAVAGAGSVQQGPRAAAFRVDQEGGIGGGAGGSGGAQGGAGNETSLDYSAAAAAGGLEGGSSLSGGSDADAEEGEGMTVEETELE